jgi:hypothetical protein
MHQHSDLIISHVFGQSAKKEHGIENVKVTNSAWDTNIISASGVSLIFSQSNPLPSLSGRTKT